MKTLGKVSNAPEVYSTDVPMWDCEQNRQVKSEMYFLPIHESVDSEMKNVVYPVCQHVPTITALDAWSDRTNRPRDQNMKAIGIWGDSAPYHTKDSLFIVLFNILGYIVEGFSLTRHMICAFSKGVTCKCGCGGKCTFDAIFKVLAWSMEALNSGVA